MSMDDGTNINDQRLTESPALHFACPTCTFVNPPDAPICMQCGTLLSTTTDTKNLLIDYDSQRPNLQPIGDLPKNSETPITLEIEGKPMSVPTNEVIIIGRGKATSNMQTNINLDSYHAQQKGVSRRHIQLLRRDTLIFVNDLGSTNGTWLNGQRLPPYTDRLLRSGDELRLGTLIIRIKF
jgi:pSer/pThr/pTyr-binding forkhead associated (FHA) protein